MNLHSVFVDDRNYNFEIKNSVDGSILLRLSNYNGIVVPFPPCVTIHMVQDDGRSPPLELTHRNCVYKLDGRFKYEICIDFINVIPLPMF